LGMPNTPKAAELADAPEVIAEHGDFRVIYSRLAVKDRLPRGTERPIVEQLLRDHPYSLFLFSDDDGSHWDFVNVKHEREGRPRRVYRRISIGPDERALNRLRTASEQLTKIALPDGELARLERAPLAIQGMHDETF